MKKYRWIITGILGCLVVAAAAYFWTSNQMDSVFAYRSPLHASPPAPGESLGAPLTRRVVIVLIDALRADTAAQPEVMPFLNELRGEGASATMHSRPPSYSQPGYSVLLTGAWPDLSDGPVVNLDYADIPTFTQDDIFSAAQRAGRKTAISGYYWFEKLIPQGAVDASFYTPGEDAAADRQVVDAALSWLTGDYQLILIHIDQMDYAGHHEGGPRDPRWDAAAKRSDDLLREIVSKLDLKQDTVLVVSDHGQIDRGGHGGHDAITLIEPFVLAGAGVKAGAYGNVSMVDVAPTVAVLLGANIPASSQGHVLTDMLTLTGEQDVAIQELLKAQQSQLYAAYTTAIGATAKVAAGGEVVTATQAALTSARSERLNRERVWRGLVSLLIVALLACVLYLKRGQTILWLLAGAVLYVALFNLRYAVLDGRTYSLSSVISQTDLITYNAATAAIALGIAWLVTMLVLGAFRQGPRRAAELSLALTFITLYLLALPIAFSYALNGALVTWTLPDFASMFMGFISLVQSLMVAAIGLVLVGVTALVGWLVGRCTT